MSVPDTNAYLFKQARREALQDAIEAVTEMLSATIRGYTRRVESNRPQQENSLRRAETLQAVLRRLCELRDGSLLDETPVADNAVTTD